MKSAIVAALLGSAAAAHSGHAGFHVRRRGLGLADNEICTVYSTVYVTAGALPSLVANSTEATSATPVPETTQSEPHTSSSSSSIKVEYTPVPAPHSSKAVDVVVPSTTPYPTKPAEQPKPKPKPSKTPTSGNHGGRIVANGNKWAMTYTPYGNNHLCLSKGEIEKGIARIAGLGYASIRVYSTDCFVFEYVVPAAEANGLKVIYGIWLDQEKPAGSGPANEQLDAIISNAPKDSMSMLIVGNEYVSVHGGDASKLADYISVVKEKLHSNGFPEDIPVTTTETVAGWEQHGAALCDCIDVFAAQVHPFFDKNTAARDAGTFAAKQLDQAAAVCPEAAAKGKYITEIGWPSGGTANGKAVPGVAEQKQALQGVVETVGDHACIFSLDNDEWKEPGPFGVETKFGCGNVLKNF